MARDKLRHAKEWAGRTLHLTLGASVFLFLTGLGILLAPFSRGAQATVLLHTALGVLLLPPVLFYLGKHLADRWRDPFSHLLILGYGAGALFLALVASGGVLTIQAAFGRRISYGWDLVHLVTGIAVGGVLAAHLLTAATRHLRREREGAVVRRALLAPAVWGTVLAALPFAAGPVLPRVPRRGELPAGYSMRYGENPFAPSLATTDDGGAIHPAALAGSASCGTAGCHDEIHDEWAPSAHRYASRSVFFQAIQKAMADQNGAESTRYCAGCHDPIALFSGAKNIYSDDLSAPGADEGISCAACHSITKTDVRGNANYVMTAPERYLFEDAETGVARFASDFLIRAYPTKHRESWSRPLLKSPEFCAACHKQFIDEEINRVGWVQLQNQYDAWRKSPWFRPDHADAGRPDPRTSLTCRDCHMRLTASNDPAAGDVVDPVRSADDGKHRNHRFVAANQWHPVLHGLPGGEEQVRLTEEWLRGETIVPEIRDRWPDGPIIPLSVEAPADATPGEPVKVRVGVTNRKTGHDFPTGPLDIIQAWVELVVTTPDGRVVFSSGTVDENGFLRDGALVFKAEGVDRAGNLIDRHNLWEMVGARFRRSLYPGFSDREDYVFECPEDAGASELRVSARLRYRKVDQTLIEFVMPGKGLTAPITDLSTASAVIRVIPAGEER